MTSYKHSRMALKPFALHSSFFEEFDLSSPPTIHYYGSVNPLDGRRTSHSPRIGATIALSALPFFILRNRYCTYAHPHLMTCIYESLRQHSFQHLQRHPYLCRTIRFTILPLPCHPQSHPCALVRLHSIYLVSFCHSLYRCSSDSDLRLFSNDW